MFQEEGASIEVTGTEVDSNAEITAEKGSRISPEKLKPGKVSFGKRQEPQVIPKTASMM